MKTILTLLLTFAMLPFTASANESSAAETSVNRDYVKVYECVTNSDQSNLVMKVIRVSSFSLISSAVIAKHYKGDYFNDLRAAERTCLAQALKLNTKEE